MIVAFTGGRNFDDPGLVRLVISRLADLFALAEPRQLVWHVGDCPTGLDESVRNLLPDAKVWKADWDCWGKAAGPIRNGRMVRGIDMLVAFPGGNGTADCVRQAEAVGVRVLFVSPRRIGGDEPNATPF